MSKNCMRTGLCRGRLTECFLAVLLLLAALIAVFPAAAAAQENRSYFISKNFIEAEINPDGSMRVTEQLTFNFTGQFRGLTKKMKLDRGYDFSSVTVSEGGAAYSPVPAGVTDGDRIFFTDRDSRYFYIDWSFLARDEERTFTLDYTVDNAVLVHLDQAELYWQFIGDDTEVKTGHARVELSLPPGAREGEVLAWGHGPLHGTVEIESPTLVTWEVFDLPPRTFLEGRVAFPVSLVAESSNYSGREGLPVILAEEEKLARQANLERSLTRVDFILAPLLVVFLGTYLIVYRKKARKSRAAFDGEYYREPAGDYSPAVAGYVYRLTRIAPEDFTAAIMDLARRGHLRLEEYQGESGLIRKRTFTDYRIIPAEGRDTLKNHEEALLSFIFEEVGGRSDNGAAMREIEQYGKRHSGKTAAFYKGWTEKVKKEAEPYNFFNAINWKMIIFGAVLTLIGIPFMIINMFMLGFAALIIGPLFIVAMALMKRMTPTGADHYAKWRAFRKFLLHFSRLDRSTVPSLAIWEHYLVYAVTLGVAKEVMEQLHLVYPELRGDMAYTYWPAYGALMTSPGSFNSMTSSMQQSFRNAFSSATSSGSGGGGGFSGGGGGGGGGGGFSAR